MVAHRTTRLLTVLVALLFTVGCQTMTGRTAGGWVDDKQITAKVKTAIAATKLGTLTRVDVDTRNGVVYLTGTAENEEARDNILQAARNVPEVRQVVSNLTLAQGLTGVHSMTGEVERIDHQRGTLSLKTAEGTLDLHFPPAALQHIQQGDRITVQLGLQESAVPAASPSGSGGQRR